MYTLWLFNIAIGNRWPIYRWLTVLKNGWIFHGYVNGIRQYIYITIYIYRY